MITRGRGRTKMEKYALWPPRSKQNRKDEAEKREETLPLALREKRKGRQGHREKKGTNSMVKKGKQKGMVMLGRRWLSCLKKGHF